VSQYKCVGATQAYRKWTPKEDRILTDAVKSGMIDQELGTILPGCTHQAANGRKDYLRKKGFIF